MIQTFFALAIRKLHRKLAAIAAAAPILACLTVSGQAPATLDQDPVFKTWEKQQGVQSCGRCHYDALTNGGFNPSGVNTGFSRQNELKHYLAHDKHAIARRRVEPISTADLAEEREKLQEQFNVREELVRGWIGESNVLSFRMCEKLGYDLSDPSGAGYASFRNDCLTCHGGYRADVAADKTDFTADQPGISCNYCHQRSDLPADQRTWLGDHHGNFDPAGIEKWRSLTPAEKAATGMRDLVTLNQQADLCFGCHIGNRDRNQFVTHEMYAAGHPPLPSIELQTFADHMPQHWQTPAELYDALADYAGRERVFGTYYPGAVVNGGKTYWNTRKMLIGALTGRAKTLQLLVDSSADEHWADYALYDCSACHHELRVPSRRQSRGYVGAPGRPRQSEWPQALTAAAATVSDTDHAAIVELEKRLAQTFAEQPFGDPEKVVPIATELKSRLEATARTLQQIPVGHEEAIAALRRIVDQSAEDLLTYDAARQVLWAVSVIADELDDSATLSAEIKQAAAKFLLDDPTNNVGVATRLPAGRQMFIYRDSLRKDLQRRAAFEPETLAKGLAELRVLLQDARTNP